MHVMEVTATYNGIVLFDPKTLQWVIGNIGNGENLFEMFTSSDKGDDVLTAGAIVPILAINDDGYDVSIRFEYEPSWFLSQGAQGVVENGLYALHIQSELIVSGLASMREWIPHEDWNKVPGIPVGYYSVIVVGYRRIDKNGGLDLAGYEFILSKTDRLPPVTADTGVNMQVHFY